MARSVIEPAGTVFAVKGAANSLLKLKNLGHKYWTRSQARAQFGAGPNPGATPPPVSPAAGVGAPSKATHKNSLDYVEDTHVYRVKGPEGTRYKIGESAQGVRLTDGASIRAEQQVRQLMKKTGQTYQSEIRRWFPGKAAARECETLYSSRGSAGCSDKMLFPATRPIERHESSRGVKSRTAVVASVVLHAPYVTKE